MFISDSSDLAWIYTTRSLLYKKKTSGTEVRGTPDVKSRFVGFIRFVRFHFGQIQKIRFVVVMVQSYSFGHLDSVKWLPPFFNLTKQVLLPNYGFHLATFLAKLNIIFWVLLCRKIYWSPYEAALLLNKPQAPVALNPAIPLRSQKLNWEITSLKHGCLTWLTWTRRVRLTWIWRLLTPSPPGSLMPSALIFKQVTPH